MGRRDYSAPVAGHCRRPRFRLQLPAMATPHVLLVIGTTSRKGSTGVVGKFVAEQLRAEGCGVDVFDYEATPLPLFNPDSSWSALDFAALKARVDRADALVPTSDFRLHWPGVPPSLLEGLPLFAAPGPDYVNAGLIENIRRLALKSWPKPADSTAR